MSGASPSAPAPAGSDSMSLGTPSSASSGSMAGVAGMEMSGGRPDYSTLSSPSVASPSSSISVGH
jgi:hypothetical protein